MNDLKKCEICYSDSYHKIKRENNYQIFRCNNCGLLFTSPLNEVETNNIRNLYKNSYWNDIEKDSENNFTIYQKMYIYFTKRILKLFKNSKNKIKLLDIGCGFGFFINYAEKNGIDVSGIDLSKQSTDYAKKVLGLNNIYYSDIFSCSFARESFDVLTAFNLLEHTYNPRDFVKEMYRIVKNNGHVLIRVPNSKFHVLALTIFSIFPFFNKNNFNVLAMEPPKHLYGFSDNNLILLMKSVGFNRVKIYPSPLTKRSGLESFYYPIVYSITTLIYYLSFKKLNLAPTIYLSAEKSQ